MADSLKIPAMETKLYLEEKVESLRQLNTGNIAVKLNETKSQYKQLKRILQHLQSKQLLLESIRTSQQADEQEIKTRLKESSKQNAETNSETEECTKSITNMADQAQQLLEELSSKRDCTRKLAEEVAKKRARLEEKENEIKLSSAGNRESTSAEEAVQNSESVLHTVEMQLKTFESLEEKWTKELHKLRDERRRIDRLLAESQAELRHHEQLLEENKSSSECERIEDRINETSALQGVKIVSSTTSDLVLHIFSPDSDCASRESGHLELTVNYSEDTNGYLKISGAKVNVYSLNIEELVDEAVRTGSLLTLVHRVKALWLQSYRLLDEVERLREKYALDWLPDKGQVTVLYGDVMCTLSVTSQYPEKGSISLSKVSGNSDKTSGIEISAPQEISPSLTDWLDYLQGVLTKESKDVDQ